MFKSVRRATQDGWTHCSRKSDGRPCHSPRQFFRFWSIANNQTTRNCFHHLHVFMQNTVCFTFTGRNKWDRPPTERDYFKWSRQKWVIVLWSALAYLGLHAVWITFYVRAGSMPNNRNKVNDPHKNWKPYSVCLYINGYCCSIICIFLAVAFFDFLPKWQTNKAAFPSSRSCSGGAPVHLCGENRLSRRRKVGSSRHQVILQKTMLAFSVFLAMLLCVSPIFVPFMALPMAQEWHWKRDCDHYPVEIVLYGQPNSFEEASISIYGSRRYTPDDLYPLQHTWMHKYKFYSPDKSHPSVRIMKYIELVRQPSTVNGSFPPIPKAKTLLLDAERREFLGCSDQSEDVLGPAPNATATTTFGGITISLTSCTEGSGIYETSPYLRFSIRYPTSIPSSTMYLQAESKE
ncbi:hypothetical protein FA13DRAFT_313811 [Coprinellus micaceus]|uniref:Uncharacterized protein n=1 Tax=Coprinellus micaceus TaxID=71717 RepID=A0A4Y7TCI8_COPMI|nr:hypothetical protein FA13DRAFT_313811 [Coprinellus micaceus]